MRSLAELKSADTLAKEFEFHQLSRLLLRTRGEGSPWAQALEFAEAERASHRVQGLLKAAVPAGTLVDPATGPLADAKIISDGFVSSLANIGVFDRLLTEGMVRVPLAQPQLRLSTTALIGSTPAEGMSKPITRFAISGTGIARQKADAIVVVSDALADAMTPPSMQLLRTELQKAVAFATDVTFLEEISDDLTPLGPGTPTGDVAAALEQMDITAASRLYLVLDPATCAKLASWADLTGALLYPSVGPQGGNFAGIPVLISDHAALIGPMLIDASGLAGDSEVVALDVARHASVEMVDAGTMASAQPGSPAAPISTEVVSLWQTNSRGLRASRHFGFAKIRADAVQLLTGGW